VAASSEPAKLLRKRLKDNAVLAAPGVIDAMTARIAAKHGFPAVFMTGAGVAASLGVLDGLATLTEIADRVRIISRSTDVPVIVDADSGGTSDETIRRTVAELEHAGCAAIIIEDQIPGVLKVAHVFVDKGATAATGYAEGAPGEVLFSTEEMCRRIAVAAEARTHRGTVLIARTDVMTIEGIPAAVARSNAFAEAGAELVFVQQPRNVDEVREIARGMKVDLVVNTSLLNAGGATTAQLGEAGAKLVLYSNMALRMGWQTINDAFGQLASAGTYGSMLGQMLPRDEYFAFIDPH